MSSFNLNPDEEFDLEMQMDSAYLEHWFSRLEKGDGACGERTINDDV